MNKKCIYCNQTYSIDKFKPVTRTRVTKTCIKCLLKKQASKDKKLIEDIAYSLIMISHSTTIL